MKNDVIPTIQENSKQIVQNFKELITKAKKLDKSLKKDMVKMDSQRLKFSKTYKDTEEAVYSNDIF